MVHEFGSLLTVYIWISTDAPVEPQLRLICANCVTDMNLLEPTRKIYSSAFIITVHAFVIDSGSPKVG